MKELFKKSWVKVVFFGLLTGAVLILLDRQFDFYSRKKDKPELFKGMVDANTGDIYFTTAEYSSFTYDFGKVKEGDTVMHVFTLKNTGKEPLYIFKVTSNCDCVATFYSTNPVIPGGEQTLTVHFDTHGRNGKQQRRIIVSTNTDPSEANIDITGEVE